MARKLILLTYDLKPGSDPDEYRAFMREKDYPVFRRQPQTNAYTAFRVEQDVQRTMPFRYFDLLEVDAFGEMDALFAQPEVADHAAGWMRDWSAAGPDAAPEANFGITFCEEV